MIDRMTSHSSEEWRNLYPFASHELRLDSLRYHYLDEGAGEPLVMVHGNPTWSFYWRNLVASLRDSYRTVVPDHIGCGLSDKPQAYPLLPVATHREPRPLDRATRPVAHHFAGA